MERKQAGYGKKIKYSGIVIFDILFQGKWVSPD